MIRKSDQMVELESRHGRAIERVIADAITESGSIDGAARKLGVNGKTFHAWVQRLRIQVRTIAEAPAAVA